MGASQQSLGRRAEDATAAWLTERRWQVLERRWRSATGELDIICLDPVGTLVGVEVKVRRTSRAGGPWDALDSKRMGRLRRTLAAYATQRHPHVAALRIDLVALTPAGDAWRIARWSGVDGW